MQKNMYTVTGFGNQRLMLDKEALTENLREIQMGWGLAIYAVMHGYVEADRV